MFPRFSISNGVILGWIIVGSLLSQPSANGWPWDSEPQPLLHGREPIRADAGSPLAWDQSAHILWFVRSERLSVASWTGSTFDWREFRQIWPDANAGLAVDAGWHILYYADFDGYRSGQPLNLHCVYRSGDEWRTAKVADDPISKILGVDGLHHAVFAYDPQVRGIRRYTYDGKAWSSSIIASGLGEAGDAAAIDSARQIIYSSHETADSGIPRHPKAQFIGDPTQMGAYKPWPLVETRWNGAYWISRVIDETGVPQQPAVRPIDRTVFYARRDDGRLLRTFKAAGSDQADVFASLEGWSGADTYEDHDRYKIRDPQYPEAWNGGSYNSHSGVGFFSSAGTFAAIGGLPSKGPIEIVPYYAPVWSEVALPERLTRFRALLSPRDGRLILHAEYCAGEVVRKQTGKRLAGYLYRDANGILAKRGHAGPYYTWGSGNDYSYAKLGPQDYDPAHPRADLVGLADPNVRFYMDDGDILRSGGEPIGIPVFYSTDPKAPFVPAYLRLPTSVTVRTFGHDFLSPELNQSGARFQHYRHFGTDYAMASAIAVDRSTGVAFYTQAAPPAENQNYRDPWGRDRDLPRYSNPPLAGFRPEPDPRREKPEPDVWIAMVYDGDRAFVRKSVDTVTPAPVSVTVVPRSTPSATKSGLERFNGNGMTQSAR